MNFIDLRSDTVTWPTDEMRKAMAEAAVGDDVYGDDPTVYELEQYGASITGKEAALFVPSGTFGNQLALFTHCNRGDEVILDENCHIVQHEAGASGIIAGVQLRTIPSDKGQIAPEEFIRRIRHTDDIHEPKTGLICLENTHSSGKVLSLEFMREMKYISTRHHVPIHLDGARIFNAAASLGVSAVDIAENVDSVMFCLSKGLCAPVGSLLSGSKEFIDKARRNRKIMGGGMRQSGVLAAAGLIALKTMRLRLQHDHETAFYLASCLTLLPEIEIDVMDVQTNMVYFRFKDYEYEPEAFCEFFKSRGICVNGPDRNGNIRLVTHYWIEKEHIDKFVEALKEFVTED